MANQADESFLFVADLHALTTVQDAEQLRSLRRDIVLDYLACGFDPGKSTIFFQSDVPAHAELMWLLMTVTPMGLLKRAVSYKDKTDGKSEEEMAVNVGLFTYPVLMAADILLYDIDIVPVGQDQQQHLEITRDIAMKFNRTFSHTFTIPEARIRKDVAIVPGVDGRKMSKSYANTIPLFGDEKMIKKTIMGIQTDSKEVAEPKDPDSSFVFQIHKLFLSASEQKVLADKYRAGGLGYGDAKKMLLETYMDYFSVLRARRASLEADPKKLDTILKDGAKKANAYAEKTLQRVKKAVGLV